MGNMKKNILKIVAFLLIAIAACVGIYFLPPVYSRLSWRVDELRTRIKYALNPPEQAIFVPQASTPLALPTLTVTPLPPTPTLTPDCGAACFTATPTPPPTETPLPSPTPTPLPLQAKLKGVKHEYQHWNNCGPATLAMALSFWGWEGTQADTAPVLKPNDRDKNVMPYEMAAYVQDHTNLRVQIRHGGDLETLRRFIASGFPVLIEKGFEGVDFDGWMGHYEVLTSYDLDDDSFLAQDSYQGPDKKLSGPDIYANWRAFNFIYMIIYPAEREAEVMALMGEQWDEMANWQFAADKAKAETTTLTGRDQYFAWYNLGSSLTSMGQYSQAAAAFDEAFRLYPSIPEKTRPWRMVWYQTGPYFAYYFTGRYQDVIDLATTTLDAMNEPVLEESFVWRARARAALGDKEGAIADLNQALKVHADFRPALDELAILGG